MLTIHHINCGTLRVPGYPTVVCHCLLAAGEGGLVLVDTGIGMLDVRNPEARLGRTLIDLAGFQFHEDDTAVRRIEGLGYRPEDVRDIVLTHGDPDHTGGLADFPGAAVHMAEEEWNAVRAGHPRYIAAHFAHGPRVVTHPAESRPWFGLEARHVGVGIDAEVLLIPLFGHTAGHCGVAVKGGSRWMLHVGDAYYLRAELSDEHHPVSAMAAQRAENDAQRRASLSHLRRLFRDHAHEIEMFGYHDLSELPGFIDR